MIRRGMNDSEQGDRFEGFIPDLMSSVARRIGCDYELRLVRDGKYGSRMEDGNWNGMIGELIRGVRLVLWVFSLSRPIILRIQRTI